MGEVMLVGNHEKMENIMAEFNKEQIKNLTAIMFL